MSFQQPMDLSATQTFGATDCIDCVPALQGVQDFLEVRADESHPAGVRGRLPITGHIAGGLALRAFSISSMAPRTRSGSAILAPEASTITTTASPVATTACCFRL